MFKITFNERMRKARLGRGLTQKKAAQACHMSRERWSNLERGQRTPSSDEQRRIQEYLQFYNSAVAPPAALARFADNGKRQRGKLRPFYPHQDRANRVRYAAALRRHPAEVNALTAIVKSREDYEDCAYFASLVASGSYAEAIYLLQLLAHGGLPCVLPPESLGRTPKPIVDPQSGQPVGTRPFPCVALGLRTIFFQVSFATPAVYTVDALVWDGAWTAIEIDGEGHDYTSDLSRQRALELTILRYKPEQLFLKKAC